jgi:hypothetical protein
MGPNRFVRFWMAIMSVMADPGVLYSLWCSATGAAARGWPPDVSKYTGFSRGWIIKSALWKSKLCRAPRGPGVDEFTGRPYLATGRCRLIHNLV